MQTIPLKKKTQKEGETGKNKPEAEFTPYWSSLLTYGKDGAAVKSNGHKRQAVPATAASGR